MLVIAILVISTLLAYLLFKQEKLIKDLIRLRQASLVHNEILKRIIKIHGLSNKEIKGQQ